MILFGRHLRMKRAIFLLLLSAILCGCSVKKRRYQKGFYISRHGHRAIESQERGAKATKTNINERTSEYVPSVRRIVAAADGPMDLPAECYTRQVSFLAGCDTLYMRNGETRVVKVTEITPDLISYSRCNNLDGPKYSVRKAEVARIVFSNGVSETVAAAAEPPVVVREEAPVRRRFHPASIVALGAALLSLFVVVPTATGFLVLLLIAAAAFAVISLNDMLAHPRSYRGMALSIITLVFCFLYGLILVAYLSI
jgi:hypothetical protein